MRFHVGQRIRFEGEFLDEDGKPHDPEEPSAVVFLDRGEGPLEDGSPGARQEVFARGRGLERDAKGRYSVVYVATERGLLTVRFGSKGEGFAQYSYEITASPGEAFEVPQHELKPRGDASEYMAPEHDPEPEPADRDTMISVLRGRGVRIDDNTSDAFIAAAYASYAPGRDRSADPAPARAEAGRRALERALGRQPTGDRHRARQRAR